jgi:uncharacterized protein (DUF1778 family)
MSTHNRTLNMRLDPASREAVVRAAALRGLKLSEYIRAVLVAQAVREVDSAGRQALSLTPVEQLDFWNALHSSPRPTARQRKLGRLIRGA